MENLMRIKWEVTDGAAKISRPHYVEVDDDDLSEYETEDQKHAFIDEIVQEEFEQNIYFTWEKACK